MTSPVVVVHPHEEVAEAAKLMSQRKIRRLPVVQEGKLVGMITENDIIRVWPQLIEVTREYARAGLESQFAKGIEGRSEEHTSELQSLAYLVCRLLLEKKKTTQTTPSPLIV